MIRPSKFVLIHYGKEVFMFADCILDLTTNPLISYTVFVCDLHLKGMDSSFEICCQGSSSGFLHMRKQRRRSAAQ